VAVALEEGIYSMKTIVTTSSISVQEKLFSVWAINPE